MPYLEPGYHGVVKLRDLAVGVDEHPLLVRVIDVFVVEVAVNQHGCEPLGLNPCVHRPLGAADLLEPVLLGLNGWWVDEWVGGW